MNAPEAERMLECYLCGEILPANSGYIGPADTVNGVDMCFDCQDKSRELKRELPALQ